MIPEIERWKRFPPPWRQLGPRMAAAVRAAAGGAPSPLVPAELRGARVRRTLGQYKRLPTVSGFDGLLLRERRKAAGYSQSGLGYLVGTNQARVSAWELGETMPPSDRLAALAEVLNCRPEDLCR